MRHVSPVTELGLCRPASAGQSRDCELLERLTAVGGAAVTAFPDACDDYFTRARAYLLEREREYAGLIEVLREMVRRLAGESSDCHAELLATSNRLERLVDGDDLCDLKTRVARESTRLRRRIETL